MPGSINRSITLQTHTIQINELVFQNTDRVENGRLGSSHTAPYETVVPARPPNPPRLILKWSMKSPNGPIATTGRYRRLSTDVLGIDSSRAGLPADFFARIFRSSVKACPENTFSHNSLLAAKKTGKCSNSATLTSLIVINRQNLSRFDCLRGSTKQGNNKELQAVIFAAIKKKKAFGENV